MRRIRINIHEPKIVIVIEETNEKNVSITDNIFAKREVKRWKSDVDVNNDSWGVIHWIGFSSKGKPIWMIHNAYQRNTFTVFWTGNWPNSCSRWLLDEDNIKIVVDFENSVDDEVVLLNVLQKKSSNPSKSYCVAIHSWMNQVLPVVLNFSIFFSMPFFIESVLPECTFGGIGLMVAFAI